MEFELPFPPTPEYAANHAENMVGPAKELSGVDLDFTPQSIAAIDGIIDEMREHNVTADRVSATLFGFGCYLGEVLIRNHRGRWRSTDETSMKDLAGFPLVVELGPDSFCNPDRQDVQASGEWARR